MYSNSIQSSCYFLIKCVKFICNPLMSVYSSKSTFWWEKARKPVIMVLSAFQWLFNLCDYFIGVYVISKHLTFYLFIDVNVFMYHLFIYICIQDMLFKKLITRSSLNWKRFDALTLWTESAWYRHTWQVTVECERWRKWLVIQSLMK